MRTLNISILSLLLISACAGPNYSDKYIIMEKSEFNNPSKDTALVYFFRPRFKGMHADIAERAIGDLLVFMDKKVVGILAKDTYFLTFVKPGRQLIWVPQGSGSFKSKGLSILENFIAGNVYFVGFHFGSIRRLLRGPLSCYLWDIQSYNRDNQKSNQNKIENFLNIEELSFIKTTEKEIEEFQLSQMEFIEKNYNKKDLNPPIGRCNKN